MQGEETSQSVEARLSRVESDITNLARTVDNLAKEFHSGFSDIRQSLTAVRTKETNWGVIFSGIGVLIVFMTSIGTAVIVPITGQISEIKSAHVLHQIDAKEQIKATDSAIQREMRDLDNALQREMKQLNLAQDEMLRLHQGRLDKKEQLINDFFQRISKLETKTQNIDALISVKSRDRFTGSEWREAKSWFLREIDTLRGTEK